MRDIVRYPSFLKMMAPLFQRSMVICCMRESYPASEVRRSERGRARMRGRYPHPEGRAAQNLRSRS